MAWFQQYDPWTKRVDQDQGIEYWACACYVWTDETQQYYRHQVYFNPNVSPSLNTQDFFYFRDADAKVYWCRCHRGKSRDLRWSYLESGNYRERMAMLTDDMFPASEDGRSLSVAGAMPFPDQLADLGFILMPPPDPFGASSEPIWWRDRLALFGFGLIGFAVMFVIVAGIGAIISWFA